MTRGLAKPEGDVIAFDALPPAVRTAIAPFEQALRANPADVSPLVEEAAVFDQNKLEANALAAYRKIAAASGKTPSGCAAGSSSSKNRSPPRPPSKPRKSRPTPKHMP